MFEGKWFDDTELLGEPQAGLAMKARVAAKALSSHYDPRHDLHMGKSKGKRMGKLWLWHTHDHTT